MNSSAKHLAKHTCFLLLCISAASVTASGQIAEPSTREPFSLKLTIDVEASVWKMGDEAIVNIGFENITDEDMELHNQLYLRFTESQNERIAFGACISLSKTYLSDIDTCQDDIHEGSPGFLFVDGIMIRPDPGSQIRKNPPVLKAHETKLYRLNINEFCWGPRSSSISPIKKLYPNIAPGNYKLFFNYMDQNSRKIDIVVENGEDSEN